jgi:hypothetical protein
MLAHWTPQKLGLSVELYAKAFIYLFDRPISETQEDDWYWHSEDVFDATPLEWTKIQTLIFARAGEDLVPYSNEQIGMGLNYVMSNCISHVPFQAIHESVPLADAMLMLRALPLLWHHCLGPRLPVMKGLGLEPGRLGYVCYMWFDVWPTFWNVRENPDWQLALHSEYRCVQVSGLHGLGHHRRYLTAVPDIDGHLDAFIGRSERLDPELAQYARAAQQGHVQ